MKNVYSFSRIESFAKCRLQFKYRYIDGLRPEVETIEAFMGSMVHQALRDFYSFIRHRIVKPKEWLLAHYDQLWQKNFHPLIKIVRKELSDEDYYQKGKKCLADYYDEYKPFNQTKVVKTEEPIFFTLTRDDEHWQFMGILDRLDWNDREKRFEIHDYKTSANLMTQEEADNDLQLALYQLALQSKWPESAQARLVWHFLLFNKEIESQRSQKQLVQIQDTVIDRIKEIEACQQFPPQKSILCDWCDFQEICPLWKHPQKVAALDINEYFNEPGVKLVSKYSQLEEEKIELKKKIADIEQEQTKIKEAALELAEREGWQVIDGPEKQLVITIREEFSAPSRRENASRWKKLRQFLRDENHYFEVSTVNNNMLNRMLRQWPQDFREKVKKFLTKKTIKRVDLRKKM